MRDAERFLANEERKVEEKKMFIGEGDNLVHKYVGVLLRLFINLSLLQKNKKIYKIFVYKFMADNFRLFTINGGDFSTDFWKQLLFTGFASLNLIAFHGNRFF